MDQIVNGITASSTVSATLLTLAVAGLVALFNVLGSALKAARDQIGGVIELYFKLWKLKIQIRIYDARNNHPGFVSYKEQQQHEQPAPAPEPDPASPADPTAP